MSFKGRTKEGLSKNKTVWVPLDDGVQAVNRYLAQKMTALMEKPC